MILNQLQNKTVWILGASSGIGKELAFLCARQNARVLITDVSFSGLEQIFNKLQKISPYSRIIPADLSRPENVGETVSQVLEKYGPIYLLIDNTSIAAETPFSEINPETFSDIVDQRIKVPAMIIREMIPSMAEDGGGRFAYTGNVGGLYSPKDSYINSVICHGMEGLFRSLRFEYRRDKITFSMVFPVSVTPEVGTGDSVRNSLIYRGKYKKTDPVIESEKCARLYLRRILLGRRRICINHRIRLLLIPLKRIFPSLFELITSRGWY